MANDVDRAAFWADFICARSQFPDPGRLRAQFAVARLSDFCECGCNSFAVDLPPGASVAPIAANTSGGMVFEADFMLEDGKTLEVLLFADARGNLSYVEIDYCFNSAPVPDEISVNEPPFHVYASPKLIG